MTRAGSPFTRSPATSSLGPAANCTCHQTKEEEHRKKETRCFETERDWAFDQRSYDPNERQQREQNRPSEHFQSPFGVFTFSLHRRTSAPQPEAPRKRLGSLNGQPKCQALRFPC